MEVVKETKFGTNRLA